MTGFFKVYKLQWVQKMRALEILDVYGIQNSDEKLIDNGHLLRDYSFHSNFILSKDYLISYKNIFYLCKDEKFGLLSSEDKSADLMPSN